MAARRRAPGSAAAAAPACGLALAALLALGGCGAGPLLPVDSPRRAVGDTEVWRSPTTGVTTHTLVALGDGTMRYEVAENACVYTMPRDGLLPWTAWENCRPYTDGTQTVTLTAGHTWPIEIGRTWRYRRVGSDARGRRWDEEVRCTVEEESRVLSGAGDLRTFHVVCLSETERRVLHVSPDLGRVVRIWHSRHDGSMVPFRRDLEPFTPGS